MITLTRSLLGSHAGNSVAKIFGDNRLLNSGAAMIAARWAARSVPAAVALLAVGALVRKKMEARKQAEAHEPATKPRKKNTKARKAAAA